MIAPAAQDIERLASALTRLLEAYWRQHQPAANVPAGPIGDKSAVAAGTARRVTGE